MRRHAVLFSFVALALVVLAPFGVVLVNGFKSPEQYSTDGPISLPDRVSLDGITAVWERVDYGEKLLNSLLISSSVAVLAVALAVLNAYALGIGRIKGRTWVLVLFLAANTLPQEALAYPLYFLANETGLYDTRLSVIIVFTAIQSAFGTYLLASTFSGFPRELLDAAVVDGAGKWQTLLRVVVPVSRPTLGVLFVFFFIWTWNEFFLPMVLLISNGNQTVPVSLGVLQGQQMMDATASSASALLGVVPAIAFFLLFQRALARGITAGAIK